MEDFFDIIRESSNDFTQPLQWVVAINSVSRSGLTRRISFALYNRKKECLVRMNGRLADLLKVNVNQQGLKIQGCGMDMILDTLICAFRRIQNKVPPEFLSEQSSYASYLLL